MENFPINTILKERELFFCKLKSNPFFLLAHLYSLSSFVAERYKQLFLTKIRGLHRNTKKRPSNLHPKALNIPDISFDACMKCIPQRKPGPLFPNLFHYFPEDEEDIENSFAKHRFQILLTHMLKHDFDLPAEIKHYIENPPNKTDIAWETYSSCERIANLLTFISFIPLDARKTLPKAIIPFIKDSMQWIFKHLEYYGNKTSNHIINNARALIMVGISLDCDDAVTAGFSILEDMLPKLIQPNGALRERSSHYQCIILNWLCDIDAFIKNYPKPINHREIVKETIDKVSTVAACFCDQNGDLKVFIGDISPDFSPNETTARLAFCYPEWKKSAAKKNQYDDFYFLNNNDSRIILNAFNGDFPIKHPSHGHGDFTSFVWLYQEKPILINPGRYRYKKDNISITQKSATGHNVAIVDGLAPLCESLVIQGHWYPTPFAKAAIKINVFKDTIEISHNGFKRGTTVSEHKRKLILTHTGITIIDEFEGKGNANIDLWWHFSPLIQFINNQLIMDDITINLHSSIAHQRKLFDSHHSIAYGCVDNNKALQQSFYIQLPIKIETTFQIG